MSQFALPLERLSVKKSSGGKKSLIRLFLEFSQGKHPGFAEGGRRFRDGDHVYLLSEEWKTRTHRMWQEDEMYSAVHDSILMIESPKFFENQNLRWFQSCAQPYNIRTFPSPSESQRSVTRRYPCQESHIPRSNTTNKTRPRPNIRGVKGIHLKYETRTFDVDLFSETYLRASTEAARLSCL